jgi:hypothetical protein
MYCRHVQTEPPKFAKESWLLVFMVLVDPRALTVRKTKERVRSKTSYFKVRSAYLQGGRRALVEIIAGRFDAGIVA